MTTLLAPIPTLVWTAYDPENLLTAILRRELDTLCKPGQLCHQLRSTPPLDDPLWYSEEWSLLGWRLVSFDEVEHVARILSTHRCRARPPVRIVWLHSRVHGAAVVLQQAGAQIIVRDVTSLRRVIPRALGLAPRRAMPRHRFLAGVYERLPWGDVAE